MLAPQQTQVQVRNFRWDDFDAVLSVINQAAVADGHDWQVEREDLEHQFKADYFKPLTDVFVATDAQGAVIGLSDIEVDATNGRAFGGGAVLPEYRRQGIGRMLVRASDGRAAERLAAEAPGDKAPHIRRWGRDDSPGMKALMESEGYHIARYFYTMHVDLKDASAPTALPEGIELRPFDPAQHTRAVYEADQEGFSDHWGFAPTLYEDWRYEMVEGAFFDASLWYVAWDGDQIAGVCLTSRYESNQPDMGWVMHLAVRRPWRKRGLGLALLTHSFDVFKARGFKRAGLGVDADSTTGAVALYERAGMHVHQRHLAYWKDFVPG